MPGLTTKAGIVSAAISLGLAVQTHAAPRLDGALGDHAVIQRDQPIVLRGEAAKNETVMITLGGRTATVKTGTDGRFEARLPPLPAGGPYNLTLSAASGATMLRDILIGDVFLCSGQSNMEMTVSDAQDMIPDAHAPADDKLRLLTIPKAVAAKPATHFAAPPRWMIADARSVPAFSAACFYMVQALRRSANVPIGAIHASWGGSRISAWMSDSALREAGLGPEADLLRLYARDPSAANRQASDEWESWWRSQAGDAPGREPWQPDAALDWRPVPAMTNFETWGVPELADYNGMVWYQREVDVTPQQAAGLATLSIGRVDDADRTWVNGRGIGGSSLASQPRVYALPSGTLKPGRNVITVNDDDVYAYGGMTGPVEAMQLTFSDGSSIPLGDGWRYAVAKKLSGSAPRVPWDDINGAGTLFNAMIAPLGSTRLAGVAWYQGESDTGIPGYDRRLTALIRDWRDRFGGPGVAFSIAQLSSYGTPATAPAENGWGYVRDAQRLVAANDPRAGLAVTLDIGDAYDIHPGQKHELGQRLARVMRSILYGEPLSASGPTIAAATTASDGTVTLEFAGVTGALQARGADQAIGFELCGKEPGTCRFASGKVAGNHVALAGDGQPVTRVRYAWADAPITNLSDDAQLPPGSFEIPVTPAR